MHRQRDRHVYAHDPPVILPFRFFHYKRCVEGKVGRGNASQKEECRHGGIMVANAGKNREGNTEQYPQDQPYNTGMPKATHGFDRQGPHKGTDAVGHHQSISKPSVRTNGEH